ncbi:MAG: hypothetical protein ACN6O3_21885 [Comamonas sp.]
MLFSKGVGKFSDPKHIRRARAYLEEARMAVLEHSIAAEHYQAMAEMYAQRVTRLEQEIAAWEAGVEAVAPQQAAPRAAAGAAEHMPSPQRPSGVVKPLASEGGGDLSGQMRAA